MLSEKEKYYIKMSDIAAITKEKVEDARAEGEVRGKAEGEKIGKARGKAEGEQTKQREIAGNMLDMDIDVPTIARATGMSEDEVCKLQSLG